MTHLQQLLLVLGFARFRSYRRWVGGRWAERYIGGRWTGRYIGPTSHLSDWRWRWELDAAAQFDGDTNAIEQWPSKLPKAHVRQG